MNNFEITSISPMWNKKIFGINFQIDLDNKINKEINKIQEELCRPYPEHFYLIPEKSRHISVNPVIQWNETYAIKKEVLWDKIKDDFISALIKYDKKFQSFKITFNKLKITDNSIILLGSDENCQLQNIREIFLKNLPFPEGTNKRNTLIHSSILRYKSKFDNIDKLIDYVENKEISLELKVDAIYLRKELLWPSLKRTDILSIGLK